MNRWQKTITDLLGVFKTNIRLTAAVNKMLGEGKSTTDATLSRIKDGKITKVEHDLGQVLLILHVRYIPEKSGQEGEGGISESS